MDILTRKNQGFSLIEMVLVVTILGLLSLILFPNFKTTYEHYRLETAVKELVQNIHLAKQKSITEGSTYKIIFDLHRRNNYQIVHNRRGKLFTLPKGIFFEWTTYVEVDNTLTFNPSGAPNRGGTIAISNGNNTLYIIISVATGKVRVSKIPPTF